MIQEHASALTAATYRKSTYSTGTGSCVAVSVGTIPGLVGIQDTKEGPDSRTRTTIAVTSSAWTAFTTAIKAGKLT